MTPLCRPRAGQDIKVLALYPIQEHGPLPGVNTNGSPPGNLESRTRMLMPTAPRRQAISTQLPLLWLDVRHTGAELCI